MARELPPGTERTATGYRSWVWAGGRNRSKRWRHEPTITEVKQWREDQRVAARQPTPIAELPVVLTGFAADATVYLEAVRAMPSYSNRVRDIAEWIAIFGDTPTLEIQSVRIRTARDQWLTIGPKRVLEKPAGKPARWVLRSVPLAASTINLRLRALENLFTVMYPKTANPVREVDEVDDGKQADPRGYSFAIALEVLSYMPDVTTPKKGATAEAGSLSRVRFETMLWTSLPKIQLERLKPEHVDWIRSTVLPPRRQKGKRSRRARRHTMLPRPLLPQAIDALKRFFALGANRRFSASSLSRALKSAIRAANVVRAQRRQPIIPLTATCYDLTRHTFGTEAMRASKNLKAVQELMGHADINQTARYAMAAVAEGAAEAVRQLGVHARRTGVKSRRGKARPQRKRAVLGAGRHSTRR